jgi:hypothetical protein
MQNNPLIVAWPNGGSVVASPRLATYVLDQIRGG